MEMPVDVLTRRFGKLKDSGLMEGDTTAQAIDIDSELQEKFLFFNIKEEFEDVEIEDDRGVLHAGSGPEHCQARPGENPLWLLNHARNALALYWRLMENKKLEELEEEKLAKRPAPGIYSAKHPGGFTSFAVIVTEDRRIVVPMQQGDLCDQTDIFDSFAEKQAPWIMTPINVAEGKFA